MEEEFFWGGIFYIYLVGVCSKACTYKIVKSCNRAGSLIISL